MNEEKDIYKDYEVEIDFKKVLKSPYRTFGVFYLLVVIGIISSGLYYLDNLNNINDSIVESYIINPEHSPEVIPTQKGQIQPGVYLPDVAEAKPELIAKGKAAFIENCVSCHGESGEGNGPGSAGLDPAPRNFAQADGWTNGRTIAAIYKTLEEGIIQNGMSSYNYLSVEDRFGLIHYIRSEFMKDAPAPTADELVELDLTYQLSKGRKTPNTIPIEKSLEIIAEESKTNILLLNTIESNLSAYSNLNYYSTFMNNVYNSRLAINTLISNDEWRLAVDNFKAIIRNGIGDNGFQSSFLRLSQTDLDGLYSFLKILTQNSTVELPADLEPIVNNVEAMKIGVMPKKEKAVSTH